MALTVRSTTVKATGVKALPVPKAAKKIATVVGGIVPAVIASPAFALVEERMNGDGVGYAFGVNQPILAWVIAGVFGTTWALYASSAKSFGAQDEEDGMSL
eukprot:jgi/Ulvmu1/7501/UM037_0045.1